MMRAAVVVNNAAHQAQHAGWMKAGLERHGWTVELVRGGAPLRGFEMACSWSVKHRTVWDWQKREGGPVLVMERAALQPRNIWTGCGFNGLAGRATYPKAQDGGARWRKHFGKLEKPWRAGGNHVLICGQVAGDAALWGVDFRRWATQQARDLVQRGWHVRYRPHPFTLKSGDRWCPQGAKFSDKPYGEDLADAAFVVTFNSTAGVESVLAGIPAVTFDNGAMAWPVTTHSLDDAPVRPDRMPWAHDLAWSCWLPAEIESGDAWDTLRHIAQGVPTPAAQEPTVEVIERPRGCALVLGGARCVWEDVEAALSLGQFDGVVACNDIGAEWRGELAAWATLHPQNLPRWIKARSGSGAPTPAEIVTHKQDKHTTRVVDYRWKGGTTSGSSGLYATKVALEMFSRAVLCGVPMSDEPHFFDNKPWRAAHGFRPSWRVALPAIADRVRSMSGWTAQLLGKPTEEWLAS